MKWPINKIQLNAMTCKQNEPLLEQIIIKMTTLQNDKLIKNDNFTKWPKRKLQNYKMTIDNWQMTSLRK